MDIEKIINLKDILVNDMDKQYVILLTKRSFLNEHSPIYVKPRYIKLKDILLQIKTDEATQNIDKHIKKMETKMELENCGFDRIEECITAGIIMDKQKYDEIHNKTKNYSDKEILNTDIINMDILKWTIHNVIAIYPYALRYATDNNNSMEYKTSHVVVEPSKLICLKELCNSLTNLGYKVDLLKGSTEILKERNFSSSKVDPYKELCSFLLNNKGVYTNGIGHDYATNLVVVSNKKNNLKNSSPVRVRK